MSYTSAVRPMSLLLVASHKIRHFLLPRQGSNRLWIQTIPREHVVQFEIRLLCHRLHGIRQIELETRFEEFGNFQYQRHDMDNPIRLQSASESDSPFRYPNLLRFDSERLIVHVQS